MLDSVTPKQYPHDPLPAWVRELRDHQVTAVNAILEAFEDVDVVYLDAPVGAGKTLIAELVRREMGVRKGLYVCTDKQLQHQFLDDFPYAKVLKGRANYIPPYAMRDQTCDDCQGMRGECGLCEEVDSCPYVVARNDAIGKWSAGRDGKPGTRHGGARVAVLNTAYFLAAANGARMLGHYDLGVMDECDQLEGALMGFVEYVVPKWIGQKVGLAYPKKGVHKATLVTWLDDTWVKVLDWLERNGETLEPKQKRSVIRFMQETRQVAEELREDLDREQAAKLGEGELGDEQGRWIRDYGSDRWPAETLKLRAVMVDRQGEAMLWGHADKWLLMSGTVVSADELSASLGLDRTGNRGFAVVEVPSSFPVENRKVIAAPVVSVTRKMDDEGERDLVYAIERILDRHEGRALVHTVSYALTRQLMEQVQVPRWRTKLAYYNAKDKLPVMQEYLRTENAVLFAPSMDRGVDLAGDACRVQVIAKCPFPYLGDKQVSARMNLPGGQQWYVVQAVRDLVQMTGRGVRSAEDWCVTYVLDAQFVKNLWAKNRVLFPPYFREAVDMRADVRWLLRQKG